MSSSSRRVVLASFCTSAVLGLAWPASGSDFVESPLEPGVWLQRTTQEARASGAIGLKAASAGVTSIGGMNDPGAIIRVGDTLYVGNDAPSITVIDASVPGAEFVTGTIATPIHPIDLAVVGGELYVVDQKRDTVWHRPLAGGAWASIALPAATWEWTYGNLCFPHPTLPILFVIQMWENRIQIVDLAANAVAGAITDLHHLPTSIVFSADGSRMAVLCTGLSAPSCAASGPNLAVFDATTFAKLYEVNLTGTCSRAVVAAGNDAFVVRDVDVRKYALGNGALLDSRSGGGGRNAAHNGYELVTQDGGENVSLFTSDLDVLTATYDVTFQAQVWFPPVEEMVAFDAADGRVFVTCRNDDAVSVIHHDSGCHPYGAGCAGSGGFTPSLKSQGCPHLGQNFVFSVARGLGGAMAFFFAGAAPGNLPLGGGCSFLVAPVLPPLLTAPLSGSGAGNGSLVFNVAIPNSLPAGIEVDLQAFVADPAGAIGASASNGLRLVIK